MNLRLAKLLFRTTRGAGWILAGLRVFAPADAWPATWIYTNESEWLAATIGQEVFITSAENIGRADEVEAPAGNNANVGSNLTFQAARTGLSRSFRVATLQTGAEFTFNDHECAGGCAAAPGFEEALSIGDINDYENDDCEIVILDGPPLYGLAFELGENDPALADPGLFVYDTQSGWIGYSSALPGASNSFAFLGIVSDTAIGRVVVDGDAEGDDMSIRNFRFARHRAAFPTLTAGTRTADQGMRMEWESAAEWRYNVERADALSSGFSNLVSDLAATPPVNQWTNSLAPDNAYYRVRAHLEP